MWSDTSTPLSLMRKDVAKFIDDRDWGRYHAPVNVASAAAVEAAELLELFQWRRSGDLVPEDVVREVGPELADVLHFTFCLANATGLELPSDEMTFSQVTEDVGPRELSPKEAAEEVLVASSFLLMATRASSITREIAESMDKGGPEDAIAASVTLLLEALAKCARAMELDLSAELYAKNRLNEERFPVGTMPDVGY